MTAISKGFVTRAAAGLVAPRSVSRNITPQNGGVAAHYEGGRMGVTAQTPHSKCVAAWRSFQRYHMVSLGWVDIAYSGGYCQHGYNFAGRGFGIRTAANGSNAGNQNHYAYVFIGGEGDAPTADALNALDWWVVEARRAGNAGLAVVPHSGLFSTACPGRYIRAHAATINGKKIGTVVVPPTVKDDDTQMLSEEAQKWLYARDAANNKWITDNIRQTVGKSEATRDAVINARLAKIEASLAAINKKLV